MTKVTRDDDKDVDDGVSFGMIVVKVNLAVVRLSVMKAKILRHVICLNSGCSMKVTNQEYQTYLTEEIIRTHKR